MRSLELQIQFDDDSKETAEVYLEGKIQGELCQFLLDTGCAKTSLNFDEFSSQFEKIGSQESSGGFGRTDYDLVLVNSIELGAIAKNNIVLSRAKKGELDRKLLGMDLLKDYCLRFSFDNRKVEVNPKWPNVNTIAQDLILDKGFIPCVKLKWGDSEFGAVWDTGASITLVDTHLIEKQSIMFEQIGTDIGTDSTGSKMETPMYMMRSSIQLGDKVFPPHKVAGVNLAYIKSASDMSIDFILGFSTMRHANWLFDFPQKKWAVIEMVNTH